MVAVIVAVASVTKHVISVTETDKSVGGFNGSIEIFWAAVKQPLASLTT